MLIAQISDTHIALDTPDGNQRIRDLEITIADINALDPAPDVVVHTGDIVHNGRPDEYVRALSILGAARAPVYVLAGNKDNRENLRAAFSSGGYIESDARFIDYAIEDFPVRLIGVDTLHAQSNKGDFCPVRAERLIEMIGAETTKPIAVLAHHPPFEVLVGPDRLHFETEEAMQRLRQALQHSPRIAAIFSGHVHRAAEGHIGHVPAIVMPCIATSLRRGEYPPHMKTSPIYYLHRFDPVYGFVTAARVAGLLRSR